MKKFLEWVDNNKSSNMLGYILTVDDYIEKFLQNSQDSCFEELYSSFILYMSHQVDDDGDLMTFDPSMDYTRSIWYQEYKGLENIVQK